MQDTQSWFRKRMYLHFDAPIGFKKANAIVSNPDKVKSYAFFPFISVELVVKKVKKNNSGKLIVREKYRPIKYAAHLDSHIYSFYAFMLNQLYEEKLRISGVSDSVLAFRTLKKSNIDFAYQAFNDIKAMGECVVIALDISKFFDRMNHSLLKAAWADLLHEKRLPEDHYNVFKSLTKFSYVERNALFGSLRISIHNPRKDGIIRLCSAGDFRDKVRTAKLIQKNPDPYGIPQGSSISSLLSNIYMFTFDQAVHSEVSKHKGKYYRYCDDMLFIVPKEAAADIQKFVSDEIKTLQLDINLDKTDVCHFSYVDGKLHTTKPLQYLGFTFDGNKMLIRSAAFAKYSERVKRGVRLAKKSWMKKNRARIENGKKSEPLYRKKLYARYAHLGRSNFLRYGYRSAKIMRSKAIRAQLKPLWQRLITRIER